MQSDESILVKAVVMEVKTAKGESEERLGEGWRTTVFHFYNELTLHRKISSVRSFLNSDLQTMMYSIWFLILNLR